MTISNHALHLEFPEYGDTIHALRDSDNHFRNLSDQYHQLDKSIRGLESREVPTDDQHFNDLKTERAHLKDSLYTMLQKHQS
ncbi:YdcH family protein [Marinobacter sp. 1Y8]